MPISPDDGARLASTVRQVVSEAELVILQRISRDLARDIDTADWVLKKQQELVVLRSYLERQARLLESQVGRAVGDTITEAYSVGRDEAQVDLVSARRQVVFPSAQIAAIELIARDIMVRVTGAIPQILRSVPDAYQRAVSMATGDVLLGVSTRRVAAQRALHQMLGQGITGLVDSAGRNWNLASYTEMAVRTGTGRAAIQGHADTLKASGENLVHIIPGPRSCPICNSWGGRVVSLGSLEYPATATLFDAQAQGWGHPNCRCSTALYIYGHSRTVTDRLGVDDYDDSQRQRAIERNIRRWKIRSALALDSSARISADRRVQEWQGAMREHLTAHPDLKRLRYRESITAAR